MNKQEMLRKAYINAVENMIIAELDNDKIGRAHV